MTRGRLSDIVCAMAWIASLVWLADADRQRTETVERAHLRFQLVRLEHDARLAALELRVRELATSCRSGIDVVREH
jgi:hypothetical protein